MAKIALFGAGGKMGVRSARNLTATDFDVAHVEISEAGRARLKEAIGVDCVEIDDETCVLRPDADSRLTIQNAEGGMIQDVSPPLLDW